MTNSRGYVSGEPATRSMVPAEGAIPALDRRSDSDQLAPIFLHSGFRTGSTWLWQKMRAAPTTIAYYEIFNEALEKLTATQARQRDYSIWDSRHPAAASYFLEFIPLLEPQGGIAGFDRDMPFGRSIPQSGPDGPLDVAEKIYVERLIAAAGAKRRIPVLSCTRSIGRARALRRAVGGRTILLHRNLFHQWASYCWQAEAGNSFFIDTICMTVLAASHDPFLRAVADWFDLKDRSLPQAKLFEVFVILHLYLYGYAFDAAHLVVDVTEIANDRHGRRHVEDEISDMIRYRIDLSDVRENCEFTGMSVECPAMMRDTIEQFAKLIPAETLSSECLSFMDKMKDRALAAWEQFEFFNRRTRFVLNGKIDQSARHLAQSDAESVSLRSERDRLRGEVETLRADVAGASSRAGTLANGLSRAEEALHDLRAQLDATSAARDAAIAQATKAGAERAAAHAELARTKERSDAHENASERAAVELHDIRAQLETTSAARDSAVAKAAEAGAERDAAQAEFERTHARCDELEAALARAEAERDASLWRRARRVLSAKKR